MSSDPLFLAIDIGTGSVRAALFSGTGEKHAHATRDIRTHNPAPDHYEQSTDEIWSALAAAVRQACSAVENSRTRIVSLAIDATCSLVACEERSFRPVSISLHPSSDLVYNVMLWLDRRSVSEAAHINTIDDPHVRQVRAHFGHIVSPENEPPKLLWLQRHLPEVIRDCIFFDLADWATFRCCGDQHTRSSCTVACKWGWGSNRGEEGEWCTAFWETLGLSQLSANDFHKVGRHIVKPGCPIGNLTPAVAEELGLSVNCVVASPMIDAHAGALWSVGLDSEEVRSIAPSVEQRMAVIAGTSTCYLQLSKEPLFVQGVWGPFRDAVLPGYHVTEAGQSVTGKLLENTVRRHKAYPELKARVGEDNVYTKLTEMTEEVVRRNEADPASDMHCLDYHAGNRSPLADPSLKGCMVGLTLADGEYDLAVKFRATVQAICCGARCIKDAMRSEGHDMRLVTLCGGLCKSRFFIQELADCLRMPVALSTEEDTVLLGCAILAKAAHSIGDRHEDIAKALSSVASEMTMLGEVVPPNDARCEYYDRKYAVYQKMQRDFRRYRGIMQNDEMPT